MRSRYLDVLFQDFVFEDVIFALSFPVTIFYYGYNIVLAGNYYDKLRSQDYSKSYCLAQVLPVVFLGVWLELIFFIISAIKSVTK